MSAFANENPLFFRGATYEITGDGETLVREAVVVDVEVVPAEDAGG